MPNVSHFSVQSDFSFEARAGNAARAISCSTLLAPVAIIPIPLYHWKHFTFVHRKQKHGRHIVVKYSKSERAKFCGACDRCSVFAYHANRVTRKHLPPPFYICKGQKASRRINFTHTNPPLHK
jgi:hypothetical protein